MASPPPRMCSGGTSRMSSGGLAGSPSTWNERRAGMSAASSLGLVPEGEPSPPLKARRLGIDTHQEAVVYMRTDCHVCRSERLTPHARVLLTANGREVIANLHHVSSDWLGPDQAGLSDT